MSNKNTLSNILAINKRILGAHDITSSDSHRHHSVLNPSDEKGRVSDVACLKLRMTELSLSFYMDGSRFNLIDELQSAHNAFILPLFQRSFVCHRL